MGSVFKILVFIISLLILGNNFSKASSELELLLQDLRLNPTRYVNVSLFGKKNKPYVAPVNDTIKK